MQGLNPITMQCTYETPCGWCTKWDKKCDRKIGNNDSNPQRGLRAKVGIFLDDAITTPYFSAMLRGERVDNTLKIKLEGDDNQ